MPPPDLTDDERAELVRLLRTAIAADKYFLSPQVKRLKSILAKVDHPASAERTVTPYPAPKPPVEPSLLLHRKQGRPAAAMISKSLYLPFGGTLAFKSLASRSYCRAMSSNPARASSLVSVSAHWRN
jgi:hypothetical protein